jgi:hypothetical protein
MESRQRCGALLPSLLWIACAVSAGAAAQVPPEQSSTAPASPDPAKQEPKPVRAPNRLSRENSPYLRQHAHNPVDWYPWGEEALQRSRREDKPIFLSIGYSACHWCHVMEHESFADDAIAAMMNEHFVCVKVDREERPDLDEIYMTAVQAMTGQGGWPMSVWLTPEGKPFYGGTYFPPDDRHGRPGFRRLCEHLAAAWKNRRAEVLRGSKELTEHLQKALATAAPPGEPGPATQALFREQSAERFDDVHGGFAQPPAWAPKFPHASELQALLRIAVAANDGKALSMFTVTLDRMAEGGMYDQLGGGFHRYSTDREWLVPHFEKMLYDNALLVPCYLEGYQATGNAEWARVVRETLHYLLREMRHTDGGFYSSQDADSEGVEGKFFVWQRREFDVLLGADAELAAQRWGVTEAGNWEHHNVLWLARSVADAAKATGREPAAAATALASARAKLLHARTRRVRPGTDDKILTAWNGMAIQAFAQAFLVLGDPEYLTAAQQAADFVQRELVQDGRCLRSWHSGKARHRGYLEDHAFLADALLSVFECDFDPRWLGAARAHLERIAAHFRDQDGGLFFTADDHEQLLARSKSVHEASTPSGQAIAARAFLRAGLLLGDEVLYALGTGVLRQSHDLLQKAPIACPSLVLALQFHLGDPREIVIAGEPSDPRTQALLAKVRGEFGPHRVVALVHAGNRAALAKLSPVFAGKEPVDGVPAAYVCRRGVCERPVTDPALLLPRR